MPKFVTCINCMDGRAQQPAINWIRQNCSAEYVDMITEAGADGYLVKHDPIPDSILNKIKISVQKHGSNRIFIVGHYDCAGHPVDEETHRKDIMTSVDKVKKAFPDCTVSGLWLSEKWEVEKIIEI
jgi:carbonic anhydrase